MNVHTVLEAQVLDAVRAIAGELHPHRTSVVATLDASLDRDLGFDSLARSELLLRISEATGNELPDSLLGTAERPRDLLDALRAAPTRYAAAADLVWRVAKRMRAESRRGCGAPGTNRGRWLYSCYRRAGAAYLGTFLACCSRAASRCRSVRRSARRS